MGSAAWIVEIKSEKVLGEESWLMEEEEANTS